MRCCRANLAANRTGRRSFDHPCAPEQFASILAAGSSMVPIVRLDKARRDDTAFPSESPRRPRPGRPAGFRHRSRGFRPELRTIAPSGAKRGRWSFDHHCAPERFGSILATGSSVAIVRLDMARRDDTAIPSRSPRSPIRGENSIETASVRPMDGSLWTLVGASHE